MNNFLDPKYIRSALAGSIPKGVKSATKGITAPRSKSAPPSLRMPWDPAGDTAADVSRHFAANSDTMRGVPAWWSPTGGATATGSARTGSVAGGARLVRAGGGGVNTSGSANYPGSPDYPDAPELQAVQFDAFSAPERDAAREKKLIAQEAMPGQARLDVGMQRALTDINARFDNPMAAGQAYGEAVKGYGDALAGTNQAATRTGMQRYSQEYADLYDAAARGHEVGMQNKANTVDTANTNATQAWLADIAKMDKQYAQGVGKYTADMAADVQAGPIPTGMRVMRTGTRKSKTGNWKTGPSTAQKQAGALFSSQFLGYA